MQMQDNIRDHYCGGCVILFKPYVDQYPDVLRYVSHDENIDGTSLLCNAMVFDTRVIAEQYIRENTYVVDGEYVCISISTNVREYYAKKLGIIGKRFRINDGAIWYRLDDNFNIRAGKNGFISQFTIESLINSKSDAITEIKELD